MWCVVVKYGGGDSLGLRSVRHPIVLLLSTLPLCFLVFMVGFQPIFGGWNPTSPRVVSWSLLDSRWPVVYPNDEYLWNDTGNEIINAHVWLLSYLTTASNDDPYNKEWRTEEWVPNQLYGTMLPQLIHGGRFYHKVIRHENWTFSGSMKNKIYKTLWQYHVWILHVYATHPE